MKVPPGSKESSRRPTAELMGPVFNSEGYSLAWEPDVASASTAGDMGWTPGYRTPANKIRYLLLDQGPPGAPGIGSYFSCCLAQNNAPTMTTNPASTRQYSASSPNTSQDTSTAKGTFRLLATANIPEVTWAAPLFHR
jgi:hypothetical protein